MTKQFNLDKINKVFFVGIGGVSMSSLALILKNRGIGVCGYDMKSSENTKLLENNGIKVNYTHDTSLLEDADAVIYTAAVSKETAPELQYAEDNDIPLISRAELLGHITGTYKYSVGVSGTHGKSTTTGMLSEIFMLHDDKSSTISGCVIPSLGSSYKIGDSDRVVFEACEYKDSFLYMKPGLKIVLNCKLDHVDYFKNIDDVKSSFRKFIETPRNDYEENIALVNMDCENAYACAQNCSATVYFYSVERKTDFYADNIRIIDGMGVFDMYFKEQLLIDNIHLSVPGMHNISNAVAAAAAAYLTEIPPITIKKALERFGGVARRFEKKGEISGALLIDDYAHHPDEIEVTLKTAKTLNRRRIICVFQPHTYSRTKALLSEFAKTLSLADKLYLAEIFPAREKNIYNISSKDLSELIADSEFIGSFEEIADRIAEDIQENDLIITMGAGEAYKVGDILLSKNNNKM